MKCVDRFLARHATLHGCIVVSLLLVTLALDLAALNTFATAAKVKLAGKSASSAGDALDMDHYCERLQWNPVSGECEGVVCYSDTQLSQMSMYNSGCASCPTCPSCSSSGFGVTPRSWSDVTSPVTAFYAFAMKMGLPISNPASGPYPPTPDPALLAAMPFLSQDGFALYYEEYAPFGYAECENMKQVQAYAIEQFNETASGNMGNTLQRVRFRARMRGSAQKLRTFTPPVFWFIVVEHAVRVLLFLCLYWTCARDTLWIQLVNKNVLTVFFWWSGGDAFRDAHVVPQDARKLLVQSLFDLVHSAVMVAWTGFRLSSLAYVNEKTYKPDRMLPIAFIVLIFSFAMLCAGLAKVCSACCCCASSKDAADVDQEHSAGPAVMPDDKAAAAAAATGDAASQTKSVLVSPAEPQLPEQQRVALGSERSQVELQAVKIHTDGSQ